jgi:fatty acid desaturase
MQYQLEHHLFPTIPRYKYRQLAPLVRQWAGEQGLEYKADKLTDMLALHWSTLKRASQLPARPADDADPFAFRVQGH